MASGQQQSDPLADFDFNSFEASDLHGLDASFQNQNPHQQQQQYQQQYQIPNQIPTTLQEQFNDLPDFAVGPFTTNHDLIDPTNVLYGALPPFEQFQFNPVLEPDIAHHVLQQSKQPQEWQSNPSPYSASASASATTPGSNPTYSRPDTPSDTLTDTNVNRSKVPPKIGTRFSKDSLRVLRTWLSAHTQHPFPTDEEKQMLQRQTGLNKTQILNWLANARRRGKISECPSGSPRTTSPSAQPRDIPRRAGTPAPHDRTPFMPLERWVDSPPENEPAAATAIARAVASSSPTEYFENVREEAASGSSQYRPSPASSIGTSRSSSGSAYSYESGRDSAGSLRSNSRPQGQRQRHRRKKRGIQQRRGEKTSLIRPTNTFQCTFCTESFSTKHTWQRHEKSLHLALEKWVCAPHGPRMIDNNGIQCCVFCLHPNPDDDHIESHNYAICQERSIGERTFHRKDHLGQHLRLVHNLKPEEVNSPLNLWKMDSPDIHSRCGFCGDDLTTWAARTDHLAEHFKMGKTMNEWTGDWGFDPQILARVEYALAPYMISHERSTPFPFAATTAPLASPRNAYELLKIELMSFVDTFYDRTRKTPSSDDLQHDACRIIFAAEIPAYHAGVEAYSWLRDLVMSADNIVQKAKLSPLRSATESRLSYLGIIGKETPFEGCTFEAKLHEYVQSFQGPGPSDLDLQQEACRIIQEAESTSATATDIPATWFLQLARSSTAWLRNFRKRANLAPTDVHMDSDLPATNSAAIDSILRNYNDLEDRLTEHVEVLLGHGVDPSDVNLRQQSLQIISEIDNSEWREAASKNHVWLARFKRKHLPWSSVYAVPDNIGGPELNHTMGQHTGSGDAGLAQSGLDGGVPGGASRTDDVGASTRRLRTNYYCFNDPNHDRWMARELTRWVAATMSPHNPSQHVPTDEELQHQARWIMYEDGDPFNQTSADSPEWLERFKRDVRILKDVGPGLEGEPQFGMPDTTIS